MKDILTLPNIISFFRLLLIPIFVITYFNEAMAKAVYEGSGRVLKIEAPFVKWNKKDIVGEGLRLKVPYRLTWSCYEGNDKPCMACGTCRDRIKAFEENGVTDPLLVEGD